MTRYRLVQAGPKVWRIERWLDKFGAVRVWEGLEFEFHRRTGPVLVGSWTGDVCKQKYCSIYSYKKAKAAFELVKNYPKVLEEIEV